MNRSMVWKCNHGMRFVYVSMLRNEECQQLNVDAVMQCIHDMFSWLTIHRKNNKSQRKREK